MGRALCRDGLSRLAITNSFTVTTGGSPPPPITGGGGTSPTLTSSPSTVSAGGMLTVNWSSISGTTSTEWIGLYPPGAANSNFISWIYVSCSSSAGSARASGSCPFVLPASLSAGNYELRLFANDGFTHLAIMNSFTLTTGGSPPPPPMGGGGTSPTLTSSPSTVSAGGMLTVNWSGISGPTSTASLRSSDLGAANSNFISWIYVSCSSSAGSARASGSCPFVLPASLSAGN